MAGWVRLWRDFADDEIWKERRSFSRAEAWIDLLMMQSAGDDTKVMGGCVQQIMKGECAVSERWLSVRWHWSGKQVRCYLDYLLRRGMIGKRPGTKATIIRIIGTDAVKGAVRGAVESAVNDDDSQGVTQDRGAQKDAVKGAVRGEQEKEVRSNKYISTTTARAHVRDEIREMSANGIWIETICMRFRLKPPDVMRLLDEFGTDCECRGHLSHDTVGDAMSHFVSWMEIRKRKGIENGATSQRRSAADIIAEAERIATERTARIIREAAGRNG